MVSPGHFSPNVYHAEQLLAGNPRVRKAAAEVAHFHLGLYALGLVEHATIKEGHRIYAFKHRLFRLPSPIIYRS
jgi:hypothetical protein